MCRYAECHDAIPDHLKKTIMAICCSSEVEHSPLYPKVQGLNPGSAAGIEQEKNVEKELLECFILFAVFKIFAGPML